MKNNIKNLAIILLISILITFFFAGFDSSWQSIVLNIVYGIIIGLSIATGSGFISKRMLSKGEWMHKPMKQYILVILAIAVYIIIDVTIINIIWFKITQGLAFSELIKYSFYLRIIFIEFLVGFIIYLIILSARFAKNINQFYLDTEKTKNEISKYKYNTLKSQINPHFLFNSLNVLSSLIYIDTEKSDTFISKLANIYRYVLDVQDKEIIPINDEIVFANDFMYLQTIRFSDNLKFSVNIENSIFYIIPLAIQILLENAIKHNKIDKDNILNIEITNNSDYLIITNNINPINTEVESHNIGLNNIVSRYKYLSNKEVKIINNSEKFEVYLPLLNTNSKPNINNVE